MTNFYEKNNKNLNISLGELGIKISGGEKQRIGIARALYFKPELLILDESTSSLDNKTESSILDEIVNYKKNMSIIMISHRLSTLKICDEIYYIEKGFAELEERPTKDKAQGRLDWYLGQIDTEEVGIFS